MSDHRTAVQSLAAALSQQLWNGSPSERDCRLLDALATWERAARRGQDAELTARIELLGERLRRLALSNQTTAEATAAVKQQLREMADRADRPT